MLSWQYFKTIRKIKIDEWLRNRRIDSYEKLVSALSALGVKAPSRQETLEWFAKSQPKPEPVSIVTKVNPSPEPVVLKEEQPVAEALAEEPKPVRQSRSRKAKTRKEEVTEPDTGET